MNDQRPWYCEAHGDGACTRPGCLCYRRAMRPEQVDVCTHKIALGKRCLACESIGDQLDGDNRA